MKQIEILKQLLSAKEVKIKNLKIENKQLKKQLAKVSRQLIESRRESKITHAKVKKLQQSVKQLKVKNKKLAVQAEFSRKELIRAAAHGSFDSWTTVKKGYLKSAVSAANRLSRRFFKFYSDLEKLVNSGFATKDEILRIIWDVYAAAHSGDDANVYDSDPNYVDAEGAQDLFLVLRSKYGARMDEGWLEY